MEDQNQNIPLKDENSLDVEVEHHHTYPQAVNVVTSPTMATPVSPFSYNRRAFKITAAGLVLILVIGLTGLLVLNNRDKKSAASPADYVKASLKVDDISNGALKLGQADSLTINGALTVNSSFVLAPIDTPEKPVLGQLYFSKTNNAPFYYDGSKFVSLAPEVTQAATGNTVLQGGSVTNLTVVNTTINNETGVSSLQGTANQIVVSDSTGNITLSLPQDINQTSSPTFDGLTLNGALRIGQKLIVEQPNTGAYIDQDWNGGNRGFTFNLYGQDGSPTDMALNVAQWSDNSGRFRILYDGTLQWGDGNNLLETNLYRSAPNTLKTDSNLSVQGSLTTGDIQAQTAGSLQIGATKSVALRVTSLDDPYNDFNHWLAIGPDGFGRFVTIDRRVPTPFTSNFEDIKFVKCTNADCTTSTSTAVVSGVTEGVDVPSIVMGSDGFPRIVYVNYKPTNEVHFIRCTAADCSTKVDTLVSTGSLYDIDFELAPDNTARIVYTDYSVNADLNYVQCTNADCTTKTINTLATGWSGNISKGTDGFSRIVYDDDSATTQIRFIRCLNADCSSRNDNALGSSPNPYYHKAIMNNSNLPRVVYRDYDHDASSGQIKMAVCQNADCSAFTTTTIVNENDTNAWDVNFDFSVTAGSDGFARIAYHKHSASNNSLQLVTCKTDDCVQKVQTEIDHDSGYPLSIAMGLDNKPRIAAYSVIEQAYHYIQAQTADGIDAVSGTNIGTSSVPFGTLYVSQINTVNLIATGSVSGSTLTATSGSLTLGRVNKAEPIVIRGNSWNGFSGPLITIGGKGYITRETLGRGLALVVIDKSTHELISATNYDTFNSPADSDNLAAAILGVNSRQLGILASTDAWESNVTANLRNAFKQVGLYKAYGGAGPGSAQTSGRHPYAAIFEGTASSLGIAKSAESMVNNDDDALAPFAELRGWLIDGSFDVTGTVNNALSDAYGTAPVLYANAKGMVIVQNASDMTSSFLIQNADSSKTIFNADTVNGRIGIGTVAPEAELHVKAVDSTSALAIFETNGGKKTAIDSNGNIMLQNNMGIYMNGSAETGASQAYLIQTSSNVLEMRQGSSGFRLLDIGGSNVLFNSDSNGNITFKTGSNSATAFRILQFTTSASLFTADTSGMKITITGNLTLNGHLISGNSANLTSTTGNNGAGAVCTVAPTMSLAANSNDLAGRVSITTPNSGTCAGAPGFLGTVSFANSYTAGKKPFVVLTPANAATAALQTYVDPNNVSNNLFRISLGANPAMNTTYEWFYHVIE